jgi:hypothetical protein
LFYSLRHAASSCPSKALRPPGYLDLPQFLGCLGRGQEFVRAVQPIPQGVGAGTLGHSRRLGAMCTVGVRALAQPMRKCHV